MNWVLLFLAGLFEIVWAVSMKYSKGFSAPGPSAVTIAAMAASFFLLTKAVDKLPLGTAYAVWTGIGAAGTAVLGVWLFDEPHTPARVISLLLVICGITGLKISAG
ncbi:MAG: multidrug efflux SMR transporter [Elusimicrobiaceae bacterium]|nr:multidrug efflux SMR transporter [Elusimicrobiaceae bacterium]